ncbi:MAG: SRPBCC family protein [Thermoleophilia bacterium]|nr:SRPBCC family protein [Thermoleophilia bacterium]
MWSVEERAESDAEPEAVFRVWRDVARWPEWDPLVEEAGVEGEFTQGSRMRLKTKGAPARRIRLVEVVPGARYRSEDRLPLARMEFDHLAEAGESGRTKITYRQSISGPLSSVYARLFGRRMAATLPARVQAVARRAEQGA